GLENIETFDKPTLFIRGKKSNYITENDYKPIASIFPNSSINSIDSGHWVHAEKPQEFLDLLTSFLIKN
ncbi:MAG: alpha/beta hydrolase, partial [Vicingaceae bacterium]